MTRLLLRGGHLPDGHRVDVVVDGATVVEVRPAREVRPAGEVRRDPGRDPESVGDGRAGDTDAVEELDGFLLLGAPAEPHTHLDKALTWDTLRPAYGDLPAAVASWTAYSATLTETDVRDRARRTAREFLLAGTTAIRTHANACAGADPLLSLRALVELRAELREVVTLQVVFLSRPELADAVLAEAVELGADLLGGAPHSSADPIGEQRRLLRIAAKAGVDVDLHTDEQLDPTLTGLATLAADVLAGAFRGRVTASHCVSLGQQSGALLEETIEQVRRAGVGVIALPATNLYLQGRGAHTSPTRAITAVRALLDAGVELGAGGDNVRDAFLPLGRADPFEAAALLVTAGHLTVAEAWDAVSTGARRVMGLPAAGAGVGLAAELLAIRAGSLGDAVARAPADRVVISGGRVVARRRSEDWSALARSDTA